MAFSRQLGVIGILGACFIVAVGCDDDGDKIANGGDAGAGGDDGGGTAGTAGKSTGGSNNNAGDGGMGGTAVAGGANDAGAAGETVGGAAPLGGGAGEGGAVTNAGAGAGGDGGGEGGGAGDGGGGPLAAKSCGDECESSGDCFVDGALTQKVCDQSNRCVEQFSSCESHDDCVPWASGFLKTCATQNDCEDVSAVCVNWQGSGYCATQPAEGLGCFGPPGLMESELIEFGDPDPNSVAVCINMAGRCDAGTCIPGCGATQECGGGNGNTCNETTGLCECATSAECGGKPCGADHRCAECVTADDCEAEETGLDVCVDGICGCSSPSSCLDQTAGAIPVCE